MPDFKSALRNLFADPRNTLRNYLLHDLLWVVQISHSSTWEDVILDWLIRKEIWTYVDIGAYDPVLWSNTYLFYKKGWNGIVVEPNINWIRKFEKKRPNDVRLHAWAGKTESELSFYSFETAAMSTCDKETADRYVNAGHEVVDTYTVPIHTLAWIYENYLMGKHVDILSIDVEGWDMDVLEWNDWNRFQPDYIVLETVEYGANGNGTWTKDSSRFTDYLGSKWYSIIAETWINTIYKRKWA